MSLSLFKRKPKPKLKVGRPLKGSVCPRCGELGHGLCIKPVTNGKTSKIYYYHYFGHSIKENGEYKKKWCYIPKKTALKIIAERHILYNYLYKFQ